MISIVTLNYNQNEYTIKCIQSILNSKFKEFFILLVDNGSTQENYEELVEGLPIHSSLLVHRIDDNRGYVGGINYGIEESKKLNADHILIMNNDTLIDENAVGELLKVCIDFENRAIVTGKVYDFNEPNVFQDVGYSFKDKKTLQFNRIGLGKEDKGQYDEISERDMLDDVFWLFPMNLYDEIGGYSNYFWFNAEQADFALRAKKRGYKLVYTPSAKLWHKGSVSIGGRNRNPKLAYWHIQSSLILGYLHLDKLNFLTYSFRVFKSVLFTRIKSVFYQIKGDRSWVDYSNAKVKGVNYFLVWVMKKNANEGKNPF